jgi:hypothetical protein
VPGEGGVVGALTIWALDTDLRLVAGLVGFAGRLHAGDRQAVALMAMYWLHLIVFTGLTKPRLRSVAVASRSPVIINEHG